MDKNEHTGASLTTKYSKEYEDNYDTIFRKEEKDEKIEEKNHNDNSPN